MNRADWNPPTSIEGVSFDEIHELFANSPYGEILRQRVRYGDYKPEEISGEEWIKIFGPDVNNLEHLKVVLSVTQRFIYRNIYPHKEWSSLSKEELNFTREEKELLCLTAVIHDWGEAIVGDIHWHKKDDQIEEREINALRKIIKELCEGRYPRALVERMYSVANIPFGERTSKLGQAFNAIEHVGYGNNMISAWRERLRYKDSLCEVLSGLAGKLKDDHLATWKKYAEIYPESHYFLLKNQPVFDEIITANIDWRSMSAFAGNK